MTVTPPDWATTVSKDLIPPGLSLIGGPAVPPMTPQQFEATFTLFTEFFVGEIAIAFGGISVLGWHPFDFLVTWGEDLQAQALAAYLGQQTANTNIGTLIDGLLGTGHTMTDVVTFIQGVEGGVSDAAAKFASLIAGVSGTTITDVVTAINNGVTALSRIASLISGVSGTTIADVVTAITTAASNASDAISKVAALISGVSGTTISDVVSAITTAASNASTAISRLSSLISGVSGTTITDVVSAINTAASNASSAISQLSSLISGVSGTVIADVVTAITTATSNASTAISRIASLIAGVSGTTITDVVTAINNGVTAFNRVVSLISGVSGATTIADVAAFINKWQQIVDYLVNTFTGDTSTNNTLTKLLASAQTAMQGLLPPFIDNFDGTLSTLAGWVDNGDGTLSYSTASGSPQHQLIDNLDGTLTTVAKTMENMAKAPAQFASSLTKAAHNAEAGLAALFNGLSGTSVSHSSAPDVQTAAASAAGTLGANSSSIGVLNANAPSSYGYGLSGGLTATETFSGSLPADFTDITGTTIAAKAAKFNVSAASTDIETVYGSWSSPPPAGGYYYLFLRANTAFTTYLYLKLGNTSAELGCVVSGVQTVFQTVAVSSFATNTNNFLSANGYGLSIHSLHYAVTLTDSSHISQTGASFRSGGYGTDEAALPGAISQWTFYDSGPPAGPSVGIAAASETTTSTTYTSLATTTDQVTVNVGPSGMVLVIISVGNYANNTSGANAYASFSMSGTNTAAGDDTQGMRSRPFAAGLTTDKSGLYVGIVPNLNPGSTTFKNQYRVSAGTGTYVDRRINVIPL